MTDTQSPRRQPGPPKSAAGDGALVWVVRQPVTAWAVLAVCLAVTIAVWRTAVDGVDQRATERFRHEVDQAEFVMSRRMLVFERMLLGVRGLLDAHGDVTREAWHRYVGSLKLSDYYRGVRGVGFIRWVPAGDRRAFEDRMRREGAPDFAIRPPGGREAFGVVEYIDPFDAPNALALGCDVWSEPGRRAGLMLARDTGLPALTQPIELVAQKKLSSRQTAVLLFVPYYRAGRPVATVEERRAALVGWVYSPLLMDDLMRDAAAGMSPHIGLALFDGESRAPDTLIFDTDTVVKPAPVYPASVRTDTRRIQPAGRTWLLLARAQAPFEAVVASRQPLILAIGGLALDGTLFALFWSVARLRSRAEALAAQMTAGATQTVQALEREVAEREATADALRKAEARLRLSVAASNVGLWDWDLVSGTVYFSPEWKGQIGYADDELPNRFEEWHRRLHPDDLGPTLAAANTCIEDPSAHYAVTFRLRHRDHTYRWIFTQAQITRATDGRPLRMVGCHLDITDQKQAEAELRSDAEFRRAVVEQVSEGLCVCQVVGEFPFLVFSVWNARMAAITGYTIEEINRIGWYQLLPDPDVRARAVARLAPLRLGGALEAEEWHINRANGERRTLAISARVLDKGDDNTHVLSLIRDVTEQRRDESRLRESEQRFRELAENIQEVFWVRPESLAGMSYVSPAYEGIWGRPRDAVYASGDVWLHSVHAEDRERVRDGFLSRPEPGECLYRIVRPDGAVRWIRDRAFPIRDTTGQLVRMVGVAEDVTARKDAEDEHERLGERLRQGQTMEAIGTLAGGIAHDFNNILGAILANVDLARQDCEPGHPALESLDQIDGASQRAASLVRQILAFSRQRPHEKGLVQLRTSVESAVRLLRAPIPASVALTTSIADGVPDIVADPTEIDQVLMNVFTNAWHAMGGRPGDIRISLDGVELDAQQANHHAVLMPGRYARLTVSDTGSGMDADTQKRIFDPFFTTKEVGSGTGLGLSVVHGIVAKLRGAIHVESQPGLGTTFELYFPEAGSPGVNATAASVARTVEPGRGQRVLFLDDEETLVAAGTRLLQRQGYEATGFTDPTEALAALRLDPTAFDIVVTDYNMPGRSGVEVAHQIRATGSTAGLVLASGLMSDALRREAAAAGFERLLGKPYSGDELFEALQDLGRRTPRAA